jgi:hypothetical protein
MTCQLAALVLVPQKKQLRSIDNQEQRSSLPPIVFLSSGVLARSYCPLLLQNNGHVKPSDPGCRQQSRHMEMPSKTQDKGFARRGSFYEHATWGSLPAQVCRLVSGPDLLRSHWPLAQRPTSQQPPGLGIGKAWARVSPTPIRTQKGGDRLTLLRLIPCKLHTRCLRPIISGTGGGRFMLLPFLSAGRGEGRRGTCCGNGVAQMMGTTNYRSVYILWIKVRVG